MPMPAETSPIATILLTSSGAGIPILRTTQPSFQVVAGTCCNHVEKMQHQARGAISRVLMRKRVWLLNPG
jgi:hypothetical protein